MGRVAKVEQEARARARRTKLDADRAARDERIEAGAASVYLAVGERGEARLAAAREVEVLPKGPTWAMALTHLAEQLDGGLVYDRDLADLAKSLEAATQALNRRHWSRARRGI
ncbi:MAG: hypothetical protein ACR2JO_05530 [Mycobacteriales bacterium]